jgi:Lar family restriction alleviation protein
MTSDRKGLGPLKPCPFCGADDATALRVMARTYRAGCRSCGAVTLGDTMTEAASAWNRRQAAEALAGPGREEIKQAILQHIDITHGFDGAGRYVGQITGEDEATSEILALFASPGGEDHG